METRLRANDHKGDDAARTREPRRHDAMIVDLHCHLAGIGAGDSGCRVAPAMSTDWRYRVYLDAFGVTHDELLGHGDILVARRLSQRIAAAQEVDAAVVLALDGFHDPQGQLDPERTQTYVPNRHVAAMCREFPNLWFGASVHPGRHDALEELHRVASQGAVLVKWLPPIQGIDPADPAHIPFYDTLAALGLPLLVHTGPEHSFAWADNRLGEPRLLRLPLERGVEVVAAHAGMPAPLSWEGFSQVLRLLADHPNLYVDVSALTLVNHWECLPQLWQHDHVAERALYGTDMPLIASVLASPWWHTHRIPPHLAPLLHSPNPWDRDIALHRLLGTPEAVLQRTAHFLRPMPIRAGRNPARR